MKKALLVLALIGLMMSVVPAPVLAQDGQGPTNDGNTVFLPLVTLGGTAASATSQVGSDGPLSPVDDGPVVVSVESADADKVISAAGRGTPTESLRPVSIIVTFDASVNAEQLAAISGGQVVHRYTKVFNGASLVLPEDRIARVASAEGVTAVYLDELQQLNTEISPSFIGAPTIWNSLGGQESAGEGVVVGVLDSGIWPEHPSVSDPDPNGKPYAAPPVTPGSNGFGSRGPKSTCDFGNSAWNTNDAPFTCNNKLIGAYNLIDTYKAVIGLLPSEFDSTRDDNGHGTHTATTAAGNAGVAANIFGLPRGIVSGIAPRAHVIAYRVCGDQGCFNSDSIAAVEQAILDDVDVINFSISGGGSPYSDAVSLAFLSAYDNGVLVTPSAGNSGPGADTVAHREPWALTVGASTTNRHFLTTVSLGADNGDTLNLVGATVTSGISTPTAVIFPPAGNELCLTPFAPGTFAGEIVICQRGVNARVAKSFNVAAGGAGGLLLYNAVPQGLNTDNHFIPSAHLDAAEGTALLNFMSSHTGVTATFTDGTASTVQGDVMAPFSSRGGPGQTLGISKPDVTAPGVQILAGHTPLPATEEGGLPGQLFQAIQGTSMSAPHAAGAAAVIKALHPDWTPGQIKSALMLSALTAGVTKEDGTTSADAFDYGSGRIDLNIAGYVSVTMDESAADYLALENALWNANYPSLYHPVMPGKITVERTFHNVTDKKQEYEVTVVAPADMLVQVGRLQNSEFKDATKVKIQKNADETFAIHVDASLVPQGEVRMATILFQNKMSGEVLRFPVTIVRGQPDVTLSKVCTPDSILKKERTECTITIANTSFSPANIALADELPKELKLDRRSVTGAMVAGETVVFEGTLAAAAPPIVNVAVDGTASPYGYFPLSFFGISPIAGVGDESIVNFSIPAYEYAGETWDRIGVVSNGYAVVGGGTGADVDYVNSNLPDAAIPNNVLAPFWTDLNPSAGGALRIALLSGGGNTWIVVDWEGVPNYGDGEPNDFQIWVGINGVEDISFVYGPNISDGDGGFLTVGAENKFGNSGGTVYFNGEGIPPAESTTGYEVDVFSTPGAPGETKAITFWAEGKQEGTAINCAQMTSDLFDGVNVACTSVIVAK